MKTHHITKLSTLLVAAVLLAGQAFAGPGPNLPTETHKGVETKQIFFVKQPVKKTTTSMPKETPVKHPHILTAGEGRVAVY